MQFHYSRGTSLDSSLVCCMELTRDEVWERRVKISTCCSDWICSNAIKLVSISLKMLSSFKGRRYLSSQNMNFRKDNSHLSKSTSEFRSSNLTCPSTHFRFPRRNGNIISTNEIPGITPSSTSASGSNPTASSSSSSATPFPGSGNTLNPTPSSSDPSRPQAKRARSNEPPSTTNHSEESIQALIGLGVGREEAIKLLDSTGGNTELAASLLFSQ